MTFEIEKDGNVLVIRVPQMDLDAGNADEFKKCVATEVQGHSDVAMDLSGVGFMDSAGLGSILSVLKRVRANGGKLKLFGLSNEVNALFDLVRMRRLLDVYPDRESAIRAFQP